MSIILILEFMLDKNTVHFLMSFTKHEYSMELSKSWLGEELKHLIIDSLTWKALSFKILL